jgi:hypothetical protein
MKKEAPVKEIKEEETPEKSVFAPSAITLKAPNVKIGINEINQTKKLALENKPIPPTRIVRLADHALSAEQEKLQIENKFDVIERELNKEGKEGLAPEDYAQIVKSMNDQIEDLTKQLAGEGAKLSWEDGDVFDPDKLDVNGRIIYAMALGDFNRTLVSEHVGKIAEPSTRTALLNELGKVQQKLLETVQVTFEER